MGLGFKVQGSRLRVETVRLGLIVKLSQAFQAGGGGSMGGAGGGGAEGEQGGGEGEGGPSTAPDPGEASAFRLWSPTGGYPFQVKKGVRRMALRGGLGGGCLF